MSKSERAKSEKAVADTALALTRLLVCLLFCVQVVPCLPEHPCHQQGAECTCWPTHGGGWPRQHTRWLRKLGGVCCIKHVDRGSALTSTPVKPAARCGMLQACTLQSLRPHSAVLVPRSRTVSVHPKMLPRGFQGGGRVGTRAGSGGYYEWCGKPAGLCRPPATAA
jgi:hypothetical protein